MELKHLQALLGIADTGSFSAAATSIGRVQYMSYMSIRQWGRDGEWSTN